MIDDYGVGRPSIMKTVKTLLKEDGWIGFYRGFGPRFLNMSFYGTTMIVTYELISMYEFTLFLSRTFWFILVVMLLLLSIFREIVGEASAISWSLVVCRVSSLHSIITL